MWTAEGEGREQRDQRGPERGGGNLTGPSTHLFNKHSLSTCYLAGTVPGLTGHIETTGLDPGSSGEALKSFAGRELGHPPP